MREIKFRAWDIDVNEMVALEAHIEEYGISPDATHNKKLASFFERFFGCDVMQFTGLKDKNGIEIYDGDIVKVNETDNIVLEKPQEIFWLDDGFSVGIKNEFDCRLSFKTCNKSYRKKIFNGIEIIGNIYENPELLKGER